MSRSGRVEDPHSSSQKKRGSSTQRNNGGSSTRPLRGKERDQRRSSRTLALLLGATFVIPFLILFTLLALDVRLGEGYFAYRYSPVRGFRTPRAFVAIAIALLACAAVWMLSQRRRRRAGFIAFCVSLALWGVWAWWAPPYPATQHMFSFTSPSSDGAFVVESYKRVRSLPMYLRGFDQHLKTPVDAMGGTRVLSNPPGMTIFAHLVSAWLPGRAAVERYLIERQNVQPEGVAPLAAALRVAAALCVVWAASGAVAYALGRLFLSPAGAAVFAIAVTFNPCAVDFVPGKDPAQLLTINAMLWAWFAAMKSPPGGPTGRAARRLWLAAVAGAIFIIGATFSLVHIWVALVALAATTWEHLRSGRVEDPHSSSQKKRGSSARPLRELLKRGVVPAACGAAGVVIITYLAIGWNIPATLLAVSRRWTEIQKTFAMNRPVWYAIGLPIFLLFLSPAVFALAGLSLRRRRLNFGAKLALCTAAAMLFIYFALGMTYELPRLWLAFLPTLILGLCIDRPLLRGSDATYRSRVAHALMLIVLTQVAFTALHWTLFDVREVEYRLISQRFYH